VADALGVEGKASLEPVQLGCRGGRWTCKLQ
jgi:hypothetical protein